MSDLFDRFGTRVRGPVGAPYSDSHTSKEAAESIAGATATTLRRKLYEHIVSCGGGGTTDDAGKKNLDMRGSTLRARRGELGNMGLVRDSGRTALTRSGRKAVLWVAVPEDEVEEAQKTYRAQEARRGLISKAIKRIKAMSDDELRVFLEPPETVYDIFEVGAPIMEEL